MEGTTQKPASNTAQATLHRPVITIHAIEKQFSVHTNTVQSLAHQPAKSMAPEVFRFPTEAKSPSSLQTDYYEKMKNFQKTGTTIPNNFSSSSSSSASNSATMKPSSANPAEMRKKRHSMFFAETSHDAQQPTFGNSSGVMEAYPFTTKFFVPNSKITLSFKEPINGINGFHVINFVFAAIETIKKYGGLTSEGIFRKNGSIKVIEKVIDLMAKGKFDFRDLYELVFNKKDEETVVSLAQGRKTNKFEEIILICADVMKRYFKSIPEALIPPEIGKELLSLAGDVEKFNKLVESALNSIISGNSNVSVSSVVAGFSGQANYNQIINKIRQQLKYFPKINLIVFHALLVFFSEITNPVNAVLNKMPSSNLGTIFAPSLFRSSITDNLIMPTSGMTAEMMKMKIKEQLSKELNPSIHVLQFFIDNHDHIFKELNLESRIVMLKLTDEKQSGKKGMSKTTPDSLAPFSNSGSSSFSVGTSYAAVATSAASAAKSKGKNNARSQTISFLDNESINFEENLKKSG